MTRLHAQTVHTLSADRNQPDRPSAPSLRPFFSCSPQPPDKSAPIPTASSASASPVIWTAIRSTSRSMHASGLRKRKKNRKDAMWTCRTMPHTMLPQEHRRKHIHWKWTNWWKPYAVCTRRPATNR